MPEITPDLTDTSRCVSVHWSLPVQCVLPRTHADIWHEAWHPQTGNRLRYRRTMGVFVTEDQRDGAWHDLGIPAPGDVCGEQHPANPEVFCSWPTRHNERSWTHGTVFGGTRYTWNTRHPRPLTAEQLAADVGKLRAEVEELHAALTQSENDLTGARLALWEEEQDTRRLHLALKSASRGRRRARARVAELETERHTTNEALSDAAVALRDANTAAGLVAEYHVPTADGRWLAVRREPNGDRWAIYTASRLILGGRQTWTGDHWISIALATDSELWNYTSADTALAEATRLAETAPAVAS